MLVRTFQRHCATLLASMLVLVGTAACIAPDHVTIGTPLPPPPEILDSALVDSPWQLKQVSYQGKTVASDGPIHLLFDRAGGLTIRSLLCGSGHYEVAYLGGPRYQLANASYPDLTCRDPYRAQLYSVVDALEATETFALEDEQLVLSGPDAELRLVIDNLPD